MFNSWIEKITKWFRAIDCWVIGPGLGRDPCMTKFFPKLVRCLPKNNVIVFDADGLFHLTQEPKLFDELGEYEKVVLTPNITEQKYLFQHVKIDVDLIKLEVAGKVE